MLCRCRSLSFAFVLALLALIFSISGCGDEEEGVSVQDGLESLKAGDHEDAKGIFEDVIENESDMDILVEAYVGLGWAGGKMLNRQESIASFENALSMKPQDADALAGVAVAYLADGQYDQAIDRANQALAVKSDYSFEPAGITARDLHIVLAESYYYKGDFDKVEEQLNILDPTRPPLDPTKPEYPAELLKELERITGG